jgi:hypothetical protein
MVNTNINPSKFLFLGKHQLTSGSSSACPEECITAGGRVYLTHTKVFTNNYANIL